MRFCCFVFKNVEKKLGKNLQPLRYLTWITIHSLLDNLLPYYAICLISTLCTNSLPPHINAFLVT